MSPLLAAILVAAPAPGLQIDWQAPADCPQQAELRARVESLVGDAAARTDLGVTGRVTKAEAQWTLTLELVRAGSRETRTLRDGACRGLAEAAAVVIAVAIDPRATGIAAGPEDRSEDAGLVPAPPAGDGSGGTNAGGAGGGAGTGQLGGGVPGRTGAGSGSGGTGGGAGAGRPGEVSGGTGAGGPGDVSGGTGAGRPGEVSGGTGVGGPDEVSGGTGLGGPDEVSGGTGAERPGEVAGGTGRKRRISLGIKIGGGVGFVKLLPGVHGVVDLGLGLEGRGWRVEASGLFVPPVRVEVEEGIGGVFRVGAGEVRGCGVPAVRGGVLAFPLCVGLQLGVMHGRGEGSGLVEQTAARSLWAATRIGAAIRWRPRGGRVGFWLGLDAIVALTRPVFVTEARVVHEAARIGGQVGVGVEVRLR